MVLTKPVPQTEDTATVTDPGATEDGGGGGGGDGIGSEPPEGGGGLTNTTGGGGGGGGGGLDGATGHSHTRVSEVEQLPKASRVLVENPVATVVLAVEGTKFASRLSA